MIFFIRQIKNKPIVILLLLLVVGNACKKDPSEDLLAGQLTGYVNLDYKTALGLTDLSGVEVILEDGISEYKALTNEKGQFFIDDLKSGTYNVVFNAHGYCQHKIYGYQFVGGSQPSATPKTTLFPISEVSIDNVELSLSPFYSNRVILYIAADVTEQVQSIPLFLRYYISNSPDVSYRNYMETDIISHYYVVDTLKYPKGSELYVIMYPSSNRYSHYTDINTGKKIFSAINTNKPSNVVSIIVSEPE